MGKYSFTRDRKSLVEAERKLPVVRSYDVLVAGAGSAGVAAAVTAGRLGAKALLIDKNSYLGGTTTGD